MCFTQYHTLAWPKVQTSDHYLQRKQKEFLSTRKPQTKNCLGRARRGWYRYRIFHAVVERNTPFVGVPRQLNASKASFISKV